MQEGLLLHNFNTIWKYSIANISCRLCITVNIMHVVFSVQIDTFQFLF